MSPALLYEKNRLQSDHVWSYLFRIDIAGAPGTFLLAAYHEEVIFHNEIYYKFPVDFDLLEEPTHAALVNLRITAANVDQQIQSLLENYWAPVASPQWDVTIFTCDMTQPDETPFQAGEIFSVQQVVTDTLVATFDLVAEGLSLTTVIPKRRFVSSQGFHHIPRSQ